MSLISFHRRWDLLAFRSQSNMINKPFIKRLFPGRFIDLYVVRDDETIRIYSQSYEFNYQRAYEIIETDTLVYIYRSVFGLRRKRVISGSAFIEQLLKYLEHTLSK